ncbi:MAG: hypothetical protein Q8N02_00480 [Methylotenera sp.]|nr:hypothetical protein [Methylotenera sp.]MDO9233674.1 hypothetical protein [Methylotenera sp.]MDP2280166.1 hypothetical protein [Methylotenera sp.]MDP2402536.1 hypothetical protein [Methylotenera sp.]MDP3059947.1 hypothetical protein [Methylotenera sp.]
MLVSGCGIKAACWDVKVKDAIKNDRQLKLQGWRFLPKLLFLSSNYYKILDGFGAVKLANIEVFSYSHRGCRTFHYGRNAFLLFKHKQKTSIE